MTKSDMRDEKKDKSASRLPDEEASRSGSDRSQSSTQVGYGLEPGHGGSMVDSSGLRHAAERVAGDITLPESMSSVTADSASPLAPEKTKEQDSESPTTEVLVDIPDPGPTDPPPAPQPLGSLPAVPEPTTRPHRRSRTASLWEATKRPLQEPEPLGPVPTEDSGGKEREVWDLLEDNPIGSLPPLSQVLRDTPDREDEETDTTKVKTKRVQALDMSDLFTSPGDDSGLKGILRLSSQSIPIIDDFASPSTGGGEESTRRITHRQAESDEDEEEPTVVWLTKAKKMASSGESTAHGTDAKQRKRGTPPKDPSLIALEQTVLSQPSTNSLVGASKDRKKRPKKHRGVATETTKWARDDVIAGKYQIEERIGSGGMAKIFKVVHKDLGKPFALKIIRASLSDDPSVREMFYREARLASSMNHPNVVQVTDFGEDPRFGAFIVMEYLQGETLHARLNKDGPIKVPRACEIMLQVAEALYFIHSKNVVHCDIKSENIFLLDTSASRRRKPVVKLLDFGLSSAVAASSPDVIPSGKIGGTPAYMAPERIRREPPTPRTDIYALGILFYEMLTASLPFSGDMEQALMGHLYEEPEPPSSRLGEPIDERIDELILKALAKNPSDRQKDMGAFIFELRTVMHMLGIGTGRHHAMAPRATSQRALRCESAFDESPVPIFQIDREGTVTLANPAFSSFLNIKITDLVGMPLAETKLVRLCPDLVTDLEKVFTQGKSVQRLIVFPLPPNHHPAPHPRHQQTPPSVLVWLVPHTKDSKVEAITGLVHPYST